MALLPAGGYRASTLDAAGALYRTFALACAGEPAISGVFLWHSLTPALGTQQAWPSGARTFLSRHSKVGATTSFFRPPLHLGIMNRMGL